MGKRVPYKDMIRNKKLGEFDETSPTSGEQNEQAV